MSDYWEQHPRALDILARLEAAAEDTRQRDLTRSLGQVECRGLHDWWSCRDCGARV